MKKLMAMLLLAGSIQGVYAQKAEKKEMFLENKSLYEELANVQKKTDKFNLYLNMQGSFDANFRDGFDEGVFKMRQLRIEAKGNLNSWLSYRYRQRLNRSNEGGGINLHARSITFKHPVSREMITITANPPLNDPLWKVFYEGIVN